MRDMAEVGDPVEGLYKRNMAEVGDPEEGETHGGWRPRGGE